MKEIEEILEKTSLQEVDVPPKIQYKVNYTLKHKKKRTFNIVIRKLITVVASLLLVLVGSVSVYAAFGGTIAGKPVVEWLGIKFSDQYEDYKVNVEGQEITNQETKIELQSTVCDDGYVVLEFDVALSKEDKEYLRLDEKMITQKDLEEAKQIDEEQYKQTGKRPYFDLLTENQNIVNTLAVDFNTNVNGPDNKVYNIMIDNQGYWVNQTQTVTRIDEGKYKVYQLYFLTDKELGNKTDFSITLKNIVLKNQGDQDRAQGKDMYLMNIPNNERSMEIDGEFQIELSKTKALENTKKILPECEEINYKHMTKKIEEVKITPLQMIVKISSTIDQVSLNSLSNTQNQDYIGLSNYDVYDQQGNKLSAYDFEITRKITYANGKTEEWARGDIGTYQDFKNAKMELTEYIIIEKKEEVNHLKIVSSVKQPINNQEQEITIGEFNFSLE